MIKITGTKIGVTAALLIGVATLLGSWYTVDETERVVILRNGAISGTAGPGLHFKIPFIDSTVPIDVQTQVMTFDPVDSYTTDKQVATSLLSVTYRIPSDSESIQKIYAEYGSGAGVFEKVVRPQYKKALEEVLSSYSSTTAIGNRIKFGIEIQNAIMKMVEGRPIIIESVQVEDISLSDEYEEVVMDQMKAEVAVKTAQQKALTSQVEAERDAKVTITKANADAAATLAAATAAAQATRLAGDAEASAIRAKSAALADSPNLIDLVQAESWDGKLPTTMVPGGTVPFLNVHI